MKQFIQVCILIYRKISGWPAAFGSQLPSLANPVSVLFFRLG